MFADSCAKMLVTDKSELKFDGEKSSPTRAVLRGFLATYGLSLGWGVLK